MSWSKLIRIMRKGDTGVTDVTLTNVEKKELNMLNAVWEATGSYKEDFEPDVDAGLARFKHRIHEAQNREAPARFLTIRRRFLVAATVLMLIAAGGVYAWQLLNNNTVKYVTVAGEIKEIELPDGSFVILNENSELSYNWSSKSLSERLISFKGEGKFDIAPNPNQPFIINGPSTKVEVLGTVFNYRDYDDERVPDVQVIEGIVKFGRHHEAPREITRYEMAWLAEGDGVMTTEVKDINADAWIDQSLVFQNTPFNAFIRDIERTFEVEIKVENEGLLDCGFTGNYSSNDLDSIIKVLEKVFGVASKLDDYNKLLTLSGGNCQTPQ